MDDITVVAAWVVRPRPSLLQLSYITCTYFEHIQTQQQTHNNKAKPPPMFGDKAPHLRSGHQFSKVDVQIRETVNTHVYISICVYYIYIYIYTCVCVPMCMCVMCFVCGALPVLLCACMSVILFCIADINSGRDVVLAGLRRDCMLSLSLFSRPC